MRCLVIGHLAAVPAWRQKLLWTGRGKFTQCFTALLANFGKTNPFSLGTVKEPVRVIVFWKEVYYTQRY